MRLRNLGSVVAFVLVSAAVRGAEDDAAMDVRIDCQPWAAQVYVEGFNAGLTPCTVRARKGDRIHIVDGNGPQHGLVYTYALPKRDAPELFEGKSFKFVYLYGGEKELRFERADSWTWYRLDGDKRILVGVDAVTGKMPGENPTPYKSGKALTPAEAAAAKPEYLWVRVESGKAAEAASALKDIPAVGIQMWKAGDADVAALATMKNLVVLYLTSTTRKYQHLSEMHWPNDVKDLGPLAGLASLKKLNLEGSEQVTDLSPLGKLTGLTSLGLEMCDGANDLSALAGLKNLRYIGLPPATTDEQLAAVCKEHPGLTHLNMELCGNLADVSPVAGLSSPEALSMVGCPNVKDLACLAPLKNLRSLGMPSRGANAMTAQVCRDLPQLRALSYALTDVTDMKPLPALKSLEWLYLGRRTRDGLDFTPVSSLTGLKTLILNGMMGGAVDIAFMAPLTELRAVSLRENRKVNDLSPLAGATNMEWLGLLFLENVRDAKPLAGMTRLKRLEWTYCARLEDLSPMESLQELVYLNLGTCAATNAAPIRNLKKLRYATFGYSKMTKAERKAVQDALPECEVR